MSAVQAQFDDIARDLEAHPEKTEGTTAAYQFRIEGEGGGDWYLNIVDGKATVAAGTLDKPDTTTTMTADDFVAMASGELSGADAFMQGKLRVSGDQIKGMRLAQIMARQETPPDPSDW